jgi:hypothetical protein
LMRRLAAAGQSWRPWWLGWSMPRQVMRVIEAGLQPSGRIDNPGVGAAAICSSDGRHFVRS